MKKKSIFILILILGIVIGFAAVSATLMVTGNVNLSFDSDDFDVIFIEALINGKESEKAVISDDKKKITFDFDKFTTIGDSSTLDYKVKNTSTQYDADLVINCTTKVNEYIEINSSFDNKVLPLTTSVNMLAQEVKSGYINAKLVKAYTEDDLSASITCEIILGALSRENYAYTINFDTKGGNTIHDKIVNGSYGELPIPEKEGYKFTGWYNSQDEKITSDSNANKNETLYAKWEYICPNEVGEVWTFNYTGTAQEFDTPCDGIYKIELWGAQGYGYSSAYPGGKGAYTSGTISLEKNKKLHLYVGQAGGRYSGTQKVNSFNGGGNGNFWCIVAIPSASTNITGGGATDVRLVNGSWNNFESLKSRIMVAAGGGGSTGYAIGGNGGTLTGYAGQKDPRAASNYSGAGGTQTNGGSANAKFGVGGDGNYSGNACVNNDGSGGGSGYYGGGGTTGTTVGTGGSGGGGSSFISGYNGCNAISESSTSSNIIHTGNANHYSGLVFSNAVMLAGNASMPTHDGQSNMVGNSGNGFAKITYLGK